MSPSQKTKAQRANKSRASKKRIKKLLVRVQSNASVLRALAEDDS